MLNVLFYLISLQLKKNNLKSACFWVLRGYFKKCGKIILFKSSKDLTLYITLLDPEFVIVPTSLK